LARNLSRELQCDAMRHTGRYRATTRRIYVP
jgi:hypothetical protein